MYAIVEIGGMQWKVSKKDTIRVPKMKVEQGKSVNLDRVLLIVDKEKINIGKPVVDGVKIKATVVSHGKAKKVKVFKKKKRKDYKVLKGHRQEYTELRIDGISTEKKKPATPEQETKKVKPVAQKKEKTIKSKIKG